VLYTFFNPHTPVLAALMVSRENNGHFRHNRAIESETAIIEVKTGEMRPTLSHWNGHFGNKLTKSVEIIGIICPDGPIRPIYKKSESRTSLAPVLF